MRLSQCIYGMWHILRKYFFVGIESPLEYFANILYICLFSPRFANIGVYVYDIGA